MQKPCGNPANKAQSAIPAQAGIQRKKSAERAHCRAHIAEPPACRSLTRSAKRALSMLDSGFRRNDEMGFICRIPAPVQARGKLCAGMADIFHASGKFCGSGFSGFSHSCLCRNGGIREGRLDVSAMTQLR